METVNKEPVILNRAQRRKIEKKHHIKAEPMALVNRGDCYYCHLPVFVAQGQLITELNGIPTHKHCR